MRKAKKQEVFDNSFYRLAGEITQAIARNKDDTTQKEQVEELLDAEKKFKDIIIRYKQSTEIYKKFLQKVCIQNKNILSARPYFRESAKTFSHFITPAIKAKNIEDLKKFDINYQLIKFIRNSWLGPFPKRAEELFQRVHKARIILIENNMPLAINRAKLFYRKTPRSHLTLMDMIGISGEGLVAGIDKWCGPYSTVFRSVCIGRMVGNLIDRYSETMLHFYPSDKRILYKANSIRGRKGVSDMEELSDAINEAFKQDEKEGKNIPKNKVKVGELNELMNAASVISADASLGNDGESNFDIYSYAEDPNVNIESDYIQKEATILMLTLAQKLPMIHRKILRLKGIKI